MIIPYVHDMINDDKTPMRIRVHSRDKVIDYETQYGENSVNNTNQFYFF